MSDGPSLDEAVATMRAVEVFHRKLHPRKPRLAHDLPRLLDEAASVKRDWLEDHS